MQSCRQPSTRTSVLLWQYFVFLNVLPSVIYNEEFVPCLAEVKLINSSGVEESRTLAGLSKGSSRLPPDASLITTIHHYNKRQNIFL